MPEAAPVPAGPTRGVLRARTVSLVLLSTSITALVVAGLSLHSTYRVLRDRVDERYPALLEWSGEWVRGRLDQGQAEIEQLADGEPLRAWRKSPARTPAELSRGLAQALDGSGVFSGLVLLDGNGVVRAVAGSGEELSALLEALQPKTALDTELVNAIASAGLRSELASLEATSIGTLDVEGVPPIPAASTPLRDADGRAVGSLHGLFYRPGIASQLRVEGLGEGGTVHLADADGRVIAAAPEGAASGSSLSELHGVAQVPHVHLLWSGDRGWVVASALEVGPLGWTLVVQEAAREAFAPLMLTLPPVLAAAVALVAGFTLLAGLVAGRLARPIATLLGGLRRVAQGQLETELPVGAPGEFGLLLETFNDMTRRLQGRLQALQTGQRALEEQNLGFQQQAEKFSKLSITDGLTQLNNHRFFQDQLTREIKRLTRSGEGLSMLIIDIDDFKKLNDQLGHDAGDEFLKQIAGILRESVRETDLLARYGGEEFVLVATGTNMEGARVLAEKLRTAIAESSFIVDSSMRPRKATVSIGVSSYRKSRSEFFKNADAALYRAKAAGKNCVVVAED